MRILVCGASGQVGHELVDRAPSHGLEVRGMSRAQLDITDGARVREIVEQYKPALIINAAAYTHVDNAEKDVEQAYAVNRDGVARLAEAARRAGIGMMHISTDYVFAGDARHPYRESDPVAPTGVYGASKRAGEEAIQNTLEQHLIVRTSWVYGVHGHNFVKTMLRLGRQRDSLSVVADQIGCPTHAATLAEALLQLAQRYAREGSLAWGLYHYSGCSPCSWYDFAVEIFRQAAESGQLERAPQVAAITTAEYPTPARRPAWSVLDCSKFEQTFGIPARDWRLDLRQMLSALEPAATAQP